MTEDELRTIEQRWSGGAAVEVERIGDQVSVRVPHAGDVPALVAEVRRLRAAMREAKDALLRLRPPKSQGDQMERGVALMALRNALDE